MPKLKTFSGDEVIRIFSSFGFRVAGQRGSHVKLVRVFQGAKRQTLVIPFHREIDRGTLRAIIRQVSRYISENELHVKFYG